MWGRTNPYQVSTGITGVVKKLGPTLLRITSFVIHSVLEFLLVIFWYYNSSDSWVYSVSTLGWFHRSLMLPLLVPQIHLSCWLGMFIRMVAQIRRQSAEDWSRKPWFSHHFWGFAHEFWSVHVSHHCHDGWLRIARCRTCQLIHWITKVSAVVG